MVTAPHIYPAEFDIEFAFWKVHWMYIFYILQISVEA